MILGLLIVQITLLTVLFKLSGLREDLAAIKKKLGIETK
jgi:hypothetical protein